ncbi:hypothetical protein AAFP35_15930 [Gordonia sp. CPCC 206044]|uniref:hypothetical protein n=1 Tax=Gordonia sp. CPCC 206044 TaxID=3140793 RepID=UPI003AF3CBF3
MARQTDRTASPTPACQTPLPGGGVRTQTIVTDAMVGDIARTTYLGNRWIWIILIPAFLGVPLAVGFYNAVREGVLLGVFMLGSSAVTGLFVTALFGLGLLYVTAPRAQRLATPAGTPMFADFAPDSIGFGRGDEYTAVALGEITAVRHVGRGLYITSSTGSPLVIHDDLVPPQIGRDLLARFARDSVTAAPPRSWSPSPVIGSDAPTTPLRPAPGPVGLAPTDGTVRTHAIADAGLADRLARAQRQAPSTRIAFAASFVPLLALGLFAIQRNLTIGDIAMVGALVAFALIAVVSALWVRGPAIFRRRVPAGTPISADFGPQWLTLRLGDHTDSVSCDSISRVSRVGDAFFVSRRGSAPGLLIPAELVPAPVADDLQRRFGRR